MKAHGKFVVSLSDPDFEKYHPEGTWRVCAAGYDEAAYSVAVKAERPEEVPPREKLCPVGEELFSTAEKAVCADYQPVWLEFTSHTGKAGGRLYGVFVAPQLFEGEGLVWGAGHSNWQAGSLFAPSTCTARVYAISPQTYVGSLPGLRGQPIQAARAAYQALPATEAVPA